MCDKSVDTSPFVFNSISEQYKSQKMCNKPFSDDYFVLKYCLDRHKTQEMCDKFVHNLFLIGLLWVK